MKELSINLTIEKDRCVQSAAKKEYNKMLRSFLDNESPPRTEDEYKIELLRDFLENTDFTSLRSSNKYFSGIKKAICKIARDQEGKPYAVLLDF